LRPHFGLFTPVKGVEISQALQSGALSALYIESELELLARGGVGFKLQCITVAVFSSLF